MIHDVGVGLTWPEIEPVSENDCRDLGLLDSSVQLPFQSGFGTNFYPTVVDKAGCLFFSIISNHPFWNGNKRTAVLAVELFMIAGGMILEMDQTRMYSLAKDTASYKERAAGNKETLDRVTWTIRRYSYPAWRLKKNPREWRKHRDTVRWITEHPLNVPGTSTQQEKFNRGQTLAGA
jgi:death-on-curing protein